MTVSAALSGEPEPLDEWPDAQRLIQPDGVDERRSLGALRRADLESAIIRVPLCAPTTL
jgi:hypothetical protein